MDLHHPFHLFGIVTKPLHPITPTACNKFTVEFTANPLSVNFLIKWVNRNNEPSCKEINIYRGTFLTKYFTIYDKHIRQQRTVLIYRSGIKNSTLVKPAMVMFVISLTKSQKLFISSSLYPTLIG